MYIKTFIGLTDYVDRCVNEFAGTVEVVSIQMQAVDRQSIIVTVTYKKGDGENGRK